MTINFGGALLVKLFGRRNAEGDRFRQRAAGVRYVTLDSLAATIGMVTQETHLFHDTICTNLTYAKMDAPQTEIESAARAANIHDFVMGLGEVFVKGLREWVFVLREAL